MSYNPAHLNRHSARARLLVQVAAAVGLATIVSVLVAVPSSSAAAPYTASGTIARPAPGSGATDNEFAATTCPEMPSTQGEDGYVFAIPTEVAVTGSGVLVSGTPTTHNLGAHVYTAACVYTRTVSPATSNDVPFTLAVNERFVSVFTNTVSVPPTATQVTLTVTPPGNSTASPSPTTSATASASASPTTTPGGGSGTRGTYSASPNDPLFNQNGAGNLFFAGQWGMRKINAPTAWGRARATGFGIRVGVLDSGLDLGHPDFACPGKVEVVNGADPDPDGKTIPQDDVEGHGTHVAGIIGACTNNGTGVVGVAPDATLLPIQALSASTTDTVGQLAGAIDTAVGNGAHVINMSLGFGATGHVGTVAYLTSNTYAPIEQAIERAVAAGVVVVAAAGNDTSPLCGFPAIAEDVICVGATDPEDVNSWYSNFPVKTDAQEDFGIALMGPGGRGVPDCGWSSSEVLSTYSREVDTREKDCDGLPGYASIQGTSMAAPHVAGVAALVYDRLGGARSAANRAKVEEALVATAVDLYGPGYDPASGYGRVDALAAVEHFAAAPDPSPSASPSPSPTVTVTPQARDTVVAFRSSVPAAGQFSDSVALSALLTDDAGTPIPNADLTFQLVGANGFREESAVTDATGVASLTLALDAQPGAYDLRVGYSGKANTYRTSAAERAFTLLREDTAAGLTASGSGSKRTLTATLADLDTAANKVGGVPVTFYADGSRLGDAVTDANGVATYSPSSAARGGKTVYEVRFAGSAFYGPATAHS